ATKRPVLRNPLEGIEQQATKRPVLSNPLKGVEIEQQAREAAARRMFEEAEQNRMMNARRPEPAQNAAQSATCYAVVQQDYTSCKAGEYFYSFGHCENRRAGGLASCSQGVYVRPGASRKDQCLERVEAEYKNCGYRAVCTNRWLQGLQECN